MSVPGYNYVTQIEESFRKWLIISLQNDQNRREAKMAEKAQNGRKGPKWPKRPKMFKLVCQYFEFS